jgi:hypothetical protein
MNYEELKQLINYLKDMVACQKCNKRFTESEVYILATLPTEAIFELKCKKCKTATLVNLSMTPVDKNAPIITKNDIIDMHNFLEQFNGDFKQIFK